METLKRKSFNVLVSGHDERRLLTKEGSENTLWNALNDVLKTCKDFALHREASKYRVFTGLTEGTDAHAVAWALKQIDNASEDDSTAPLTELYCVAETSKLSPKFCEQSGANERDLQIITIAPGSNLDTSTVDKNLAQAGSVNPSKQSYQNPIWTDITDGYKLLEADILIAVWDGHEAKGPLGGVVRVIEESMKRRKPIIWINCNSASVFYSDPSLIPDTKLPALNSLLPSSMTEHFKKICTKNLKQELISIFNRFDEGEQKSLALKNNLTNKKLDPKGKKIYSGILYPWFMSLTGSSKFRISTEIKAYREDVDENSYLGEEYWKEFDRLDRTSLHMGGKFRSKVIFIHLLSALAVLGAVAGAIHWLDLGSGFWGIMELLVLMLIFIMIKNNKANDTTEKDIWLQTRQAAEAMRVSGLLYPYLSTIPELHYSTWSSEGGKTLKLQTPSHWLTIQNLREAEPLKSSNDSSIRYTLTDNFKILKERLKGVVEGQQNYHASTSKKNKTSFHHIHSAVKVIFFLALAAVSFHVYAIVVEHFLADGHSLWLSFAHIIEDQKWLLLLTAFAPALAATLHGIATMLELKRVASSSNKMDTQLSSILHDIELLKDENNDMALHSLASRSSEIFYKEHSSWVQLIDNQELEVPA